MPNKHAQCIDKQPGELRRSRGAFWGFFSQICSFVTKFSPIFSEIVHHKVLGRVYLSRCVYLALYGTILCWMNNHCTFTDNVPCIIFMWNTRDLCWPFSCETRVLCVTWICATWADFCRTLQYRVFTSFFARMWSISTYFWGKDFMRRAGGTFWAALLVWICPCYFHIMGQTSGAKYRNNTVNSKLYNYSKPDASHGRKWLEKPLPVCSVFCTQ